MSYYDNKIFNVNGCGQEKLLATLRLVQMDNNNPIYNKFKAYKISKKHGLILFWYIEKNDTSIPFPTELTAEEVAPIVMKWLNTKEAMETEMSDWDKNIDHDGSNSVGWRVYCEDWGHVDNSNCAVCAIKPVFLWHGK